ncbi:lysozyme [Methylococcaceae bacterium WWC4]|nr:lysozyme [Methylococcaceae bacterium WWC4]
MHTDNPHDASPAAFEIITRNGHDSLNLQAYLCPANRLTIGYGHVLLPKSDWHLFSNCDASRLMRLIRECQQRGKVVEEARTVLHINPSQAQDLLTRDVAQTALFLRSVTSVLLNQHQFDALVSLIFNIGQGQYAQSTLRKKLEAGDLAGAAAEFDRWVKGSVDGVKQILPGLVSRRAAERALFEAVA